MTDKNKSPPTGTDAHQKKSKNMKGLYIMSDEKSKVIFSNIPLEMADIPRWVLWKLEQKDGKLTKVPCNISSDRACDVNSSSNWLDCHVAFVALVRNAKFNGLGFVLSPFDDICCVDVDDCIDDNGNLNDIAKDAMAICGNTYTEKSQSGRGIHIFFKDSQFIRNRKGTIEIYGDKRFIAVTGDRISDSREIAATDGACSKLIGKYFSDNTEHTGDFPELCFEKLDELDSAERNAVDYFRSDKCKQKDVAMFNLFKDGDIDAYFKRRRDLGCPAKDESPSGADISLMLKILFYVGTSNDKAKSLQRTLKVFNKSALARRDKWLNRADYQTRTLERAFSIWVEKGCRTAGKSAADDFDVIPDDVSPFDGLENLKPTAGNILQVISAEHKPALNALFRNRDFAEFQKAIPEPDKYSLWLAEVLAKFFDNPAELKAFIAEKLKKCNVPFQDFDFPFPDGEKFDFTRSFKIQLDQFAHHSDNIKKSLLRLDYKSAKNFLYTDFTNLECAELLIKFQAHYLRYDVLQDDWYVWSENKWSCVEVQSNSRIFDLWTPLARKTRVLAEFEKFKRYSELAEYEINYPEYSQKGTAHNQIWQHYKNEASRADKKFKQTITLENSANIGHILTQASGLPEIKLETHDFNSNKFLLNCKNGTFDLEHMEFYSARRTDLITMSSPVNYDPSKQSELWLDFISYALPDIDTRNWLQKYLGYCLTADTSQQIFLMVYGVGGCGKSVTFETISKILGDYAESFNPDLITSNSKQRDGNEASPELAALKDKRLAVSSETERGKRFDEPKIKRLTGGNRLSCRKLHKAPFQFEPQFKIIIDGNYRLNISDVKDIGLQRRIRIIQFNNPPEVPDPTLAAKLATPENQSGILNWLIEGYQRYLQEGLPRPGDSDFPAAMQTELEEFYSTNDTIRDFVADCGYVDAEQTVKNRVAVKEIWQDYVEWTRNNKVAKLLRNDFVQSVLQMFKGKVKLITIKHKDFFEGMIKIFDDFDAE